ncbi:MAG: YqaA family protein [Phycisphaerae bacterium]|jgi:membrane protein YqaA with SNARE-associated domain|nr:YqaA family protein [Phycisphaerae bacterium]
MNTDDSIPSDVQDGGEAASVCPRCGLAAAPGAEYCRRCAAKLGPHKKVPWWHVHRRMYDWVLHFAHHKHSTTALFCLSFAESSFFPIPPDVLLGPLCLGNRRKSMWFATVTTVASILGAYLGYLIGFAFINVAVMIPGITHEDIKVLAREFEVRGQWYVFIAALTPIPFKLLTITAGVAKMNLAVFTLACLIGRSMRFFGVAGVFWLIGPKALPFIDKWFNWLALVFAAMLVGGFVVMKYVF